MRYFASGTPGNLPEHVVGLPVIGIQFMSEISHDCSLDYFTVWAADFRPSAYRECKDLACILKPCPRLHSLLE